MLDKSRIDFKIGSYGVAPGTALEDPMWLPRVQAYRRQLGARMIAFDKYTASKKVPGGEFYISRKIDGEFSVLIYQDGNAVLVNPGGTVRVGLPVLDEAKGLLKKAGIKNAMIPGELYVRREDGKRARVHDVSRFARKPENQGQVDRLCFAPFDLLETDGEEWGQDYSETWKWLTDTFGNSDLVQPVETQVGDGSKAVLSRFEQWVEEEDGEGVVARSDESGWFKVKPRHSLDVCVIGFAEGTDDRSGMLHDLLLGIYRIDGSVQVLGRVGGGFTDDQRRDFLSDLRDMVVESEYTEINSDRVAYEMVRPEWVVEISCLDVISNTTRGATIDRMVLEWVPDSSDEEKGIWKTARRLPLCSVISPQFKRLRDDKTPGPVDCRFSQITDLVEIELAEATSEDLQLPKSEVIKREVRVKELKGKKMVRKLIMWKTNKESVTRREYPAYVVHLTDFSPNRKEPMNREIRVSDSKEQIEELYQSLFDASFVKGWNEPGGSDSPAPVKKKAAAKKKAPAAKKKSPAKKAKAKEKAATKKKAAAKKSTAAKK
ncbi:MAG: hypothetical protein P1V20_32605, partial [Verrucomicrobiales bacterium]|nr:hypothetical protein [Verrucomicrobiales bacterium]